MRYSDSMDYLLSLQKQGIKLGLEKMQMILGLLGNPQKNFQVIHVAGTNGKGSVSALCASMLAAHGCRTGLYTSPHLVSFTERIRINWAEITESEVVEMIEEIREVLDCRPDVTAPTFFEFVTAMAFLFFARNKIEWAVVETGMGGRLDATNVVEPAVSVITSIGMDHREYLGNSLLEIAGEKAGIIKHGVAVVSSSQRADVQCVIAQAAAARGCSVAFHGRDFFGRVKNSSLDGTEFDFVSRNKMLAGCRVSLAGAFQAENAAVALRAVETALGTLRNGVQPIFSVEKARSGLRDAQWHGRLEVVGRAPLTVVDGAHNPAAAEALAEFVRSSLAEYDVILVAGMLADKDIAGVMQPLCSCATSVVITAPDSSRAADPELLASFVREYGMDCGVVPSVPAALEHARLLCRNRAALSGREPLILVAGSLYVVGEARRACGSASLLGEVREWR